MNGVSRHQNRHRTQLVHQGQSGEIEFETAQRRGPRGKCILAVIDADHNVTETDEANNTDASPPIPALP